MSRITTIIYFFLEKNKIIVMPKTHSYSTWTAGIAFFAFASLIKLSVSMVTDNFDTYLTCAE